MMKMRREKGCPLLSCYHVCSSFGGNTFWPWDWSYLSSSVRFTPLNQKALCMRDLTQSITRIWWVKWPAKQFSLDETIDVIYIDQDGPRKFRTCLEVLISSLIKWILSISSSVFLILSNNIVNFQGQYSVHSYIDSYIPKRLLVFENYFIFKPAEIVKIVHSVENKA